MDELSFENPDSQRAYEIITLLREKSLLDTRDERKKNYEALLKNYSLRAKKAVAGVPADWDEASKLWIAYLELEPRDTEAQAAMREVLRSKTLSEARGLFGKDKSRAWALLDESLQNPYLETDPAFFAELVRLAVRYQDFERAERYLDALIDIKGEDSDVVRDMQQMILEAQDWAEALLSSQEHFRDENYVDAVSALDNVIESYPDSTSELRWKKERDRIVSKAISQLLKEARRKERLASGSDLLEVIRLYSQAIQLAAGDNSRAVKEAETGITKVRSELPQLINSVISEANSFNPDNRDPVEAKRDAENILRKLTDFMAVVPYLGEEKGKYRRRLDAARSKLSRQHDVLQRVTDSLHRVQSIIQEPYSDQIIAEAKRLLKQAKRDLPRAVGIDDLESELNKIEAERKAVKQILNDLKEAIEGDDDPESFQRVLDAVRELRRIDFDDHYQLQTPQALNFYYDYLDKYVNSLSEHEQLARQRQENYRTYSEWERKVIPFYDDFQKVFDDLKSKRNTGSLEDVLEAIHRAIGAANRALTELTKSPKAEPLSEPAEMINNDMNELQDELSQEVIKLEDELKRVEEKIARRNSLENDLRIFLEHRKPALVNKMQAERVLQDLRLVDPNWPLLLRYEQRFKLWSEKKKRKKIFGLF